MRQITNTWTRRRFLQQACTAGALLAAGGLCPLFSPLPSLAAAPRSEQQTRLLMGTFVTITAVSPDAGRAQEAMALAFAEMERLIAIFDRHTGASALGTLNAEGRLRDAPPELTALLAESERLGRATGHAYNPAVTPLVDLFEAAAAVGASPGNGELREAMALSRPGGIRMTGSLLRLERSGMRLTLDGTAKGYIADQASRVLCAAGVNDHMVNAGGDIRVSGQAAPGRPWTLGIRHPDGAERLLASVPLGSGGLATSGAYERFYDSERTRHHLVSHLTGKSPRVLSVSVIAPTAAQADALATAVALMRPADALRHIDATPGTACLFLTAQGSMRKSARWA